MEDYIQNIELRVEEPSDRDLIC